MGVAALFIGATPGHGGALALHAGGARPGGIGKEGRV
jgi:hypothetical protein